MPKQIVSTVVPKNRSKDTLQKAKSFRVHSSDEQRVIESFFESLDTSVALSCYMLFRAGEIDQLVSKEINPDDYVDMDLFRGDLAAVSFLRKNSFLKSSFNTKEKALASFWESETHCGSSNSRFKMYLQGKVIPDLDESVLNSMIRKIDRILGPFDIDEVLDEAKWGPGVTQTVKGCDTSGAAKFDSDSDITSDAYALYGDVCRLAYPTWEAWSKPSFKKGCVVLTVPKNAKTDRTIAVEPGLNVWLQLGIGKLIRKRLRWAGFNLDSDLKNQRGAYIGSVTDRLATVDFTAASDSISCGLVELLLPPVWYRALNAARSSYFTLDKKNYTRSTKFSTMGNGFTFELESLIFVALALALCENLGVSDENVSIFGDDLIVPVECKTKLLSMCSFLGFRINPEKSFFSGPFRESCGSYYYAGHDVKPIFFKKGLTGVKDVYRLANSISNLASRHSTCTGRAARFRRVWSLLVHLVPNEIRLLGPVSSGDSTIHVDLNEVDAPRHPSGWCGYIYTGLLDRPVERQSESHGLLLSRLSSRSVDRSFKNYLPLRSRTRMVLKRNMFVHQWYELGPWT